jgi:hypothetical protein
MKLSSQKGETGKFGTKRISYNKALVDKFLNSAWLFL